MPIISVNEAKINVFVTPGPRVTWALVYLVKCSMNQKRKPLKPDRPLASFVFPKKGKPRRAIEHLPRTQDELEVAVGRKFTGSLSHFLGRNLSELVSGAGRGDLLCRDEKGSVIKIQVVEVVNQNLRKLSEMRNNYSEYISKRHAVVLNKFRGCAVTLVDVGDPPYLASIRSTLGQSCAKQLVQWLSDIGNEIDTLECKKIRSRRLTVTPFQREVSVTVERYLPAEDSAPMSFSWSGGGPGYRVDQPRNLLPSAVRGKINKHYPKPQEEFWLLAYSTDTLLHGDDPDIEQTASLLSDLDHPFDQAWYFYPYNNVDLGHVVHVWPAT